MTEDEWFTTNDFRAMMVFLRGECTPEERAKGGLSSSAGLLTRGHVQRTTPARLRTFATAFLPKWRELPHDEPSREVLDAYEAFLRGVGTREQLWEKYIVLAEIAKTSAQPLLNAIAGWWDDTPYGVAQMTWNLETNYAAYVARDEIAELERNATDDQREDWSWCGYPDSPRWSETVVALQREFVWLLREVVGNPFRPVTFDPSWRTDTATAIARQMYEARDFSAMPILADALQDAGCDNSDILSHCREEGATHVRGCWVADLVLGKE